MIRALEQAIREKLRPWHDDDYLQIYLGSNRLANNFNSALIRVGDWHHKCGHLLEQMTAVLNSNDNFAVDDTFVVDLPTFALHAAWVPANWAPTPLPIW